MTERHSNYRFNQNEIQNAVMHVVAFAAVAPDPCIGMTDLTVGQFWWAEYGRHMMIFGGEYGNLRVPRIHPFTIGDGVEDTFVIEHNMKHFDVMEQVRENSGGTATVPNDGSVYTATRNSEDEMTFVFVTPPTLNQYRVMIIG